MQHRFVESRLTLRKEQIEKIVPGATYAMSVEMEIACSKSRNR
jgi:hypothetical protein